MQDPPVIFLPTAGLLLPLLPTGSMALRRGSLTRPGSAPWMSRCVSNTSPCAPLPCAALHPPWLPSLSSFLDAGDSQHTTHLSPSLGKCSCFQPSPGPSFSLPCTGATACGLLSPDSPIAGPALCGPCPRLHTVPSRRPAGVSNK